MVEEEYVYILSISIWIAHQKSNYKELKINLQNRIELFNYEWYSRAYSIGSSTINMISMMIVYYLLLLLFCVWVKMRRERRKVPIHGSTTAYEGSLRAQYVPWVFYKTLGTFSGSQRITNKCAWGKLWELKMFHTKL